MTNFRYFPLFTKFTKISRIRKFLVLQYLPAKNVNGEGDGAGAREKESFADEEICGDRYRIDLAKWWLDQRVAILAHQPLCSDKLDKQPSSSPVLHGSSCSRSLQQRWPLRSSPACCARDVTSTLSTPAQLLRFLKSTKWHCNSTTLQLNRTAT